MGITQVVFIGESFIGVTQVVFIGESFIGGNNTSRVYW